MDINVVAEETSDGWLCKVTVSENDSKTEHEVSLSKNDHKKIAGNATPEQLVKKSFEFLLEREPKESIFKEFDLMLISKYFPEYLSDIRKRL